MDDLEYLEKIFLTQKEYLGTNKTVNKIKPLVSICVITYQHAQFIKNCLDGILMQKTNFPFEIVIGEDESNDGTQEICSTYAENHSDKIRLFLRNRKQSILTQNGQNVILNGILTLKSCQGKYIAMCEGDDFWIDPYKLQKQVEILELNKNKNITAVVTNTSFCNEKGIITKVKGFNFKDNNQSGINNLHDFFKNKTLYPTATVMFKNELSNIIPKLEFMKNPFLGDWILWILIHLNGDFYILDEQTACYRVHESSLTHTVNAIERWKFDLIIRKKLKTIIPINYHQYLNEDWYAYLRIATAYRKQKKYFHFFCYIGFSFFSNPIKFYREIYNSHN